MLDASGRLVLPGLVDLHAHVYPYGSALGIPADALVPYQGTTTMVSAGDAGANNFAAFRRYVQAQTRTRLYAFVHIANIGLSGFPEPELYHLGFAMPGEAGRTVAENGTGVMATSASLRPCLSSAALSHRWPEVEKPLMPTILPLRSPTVLIGELSLT